MNLYWVKWVCQGHQGWRIKTRLLGVKPKNFAASYCFIQDLSQYSKHGLKTLDYRNRKCMLPYSSSKPHKYTQKFAYRKQPSTIYSPSLRHHPWSFWSQSKMRSQWRTSVSESKRASTLCTTSWKLAMRNTWKGIRILRTSSLRKRMIWWPTL